MLFRLTKAREAHLRDETASRRHDAMRFIIFYFLCQSGTIAAFL